MKPSEIVIETIRLLNHFKPPEQPFFYLTEFPGDSFDDNQMSYYKVELLSSDIGYNEARSTVVIDDYNRKRMIKRFSKSRLIATARQAVNPPSEDEIRERAYKTLISAIIQRSINDLPQNDFIETLFPEHENHSGQQQPDASSGSY